MPANSMTSSSQKIIILLGDPMISADTMLADFTAVVPSDYRLVPYRWQISTDEVVEVNRQVELGGPSAVSLMPIPVDDPATVVGVVTHFHPLTAEQLAQWPHLEFVATLRSGTENVASDALLEREIPLLRNVGRNANAVAEFTIAAMLGLLRQIGEDHHSVRSGGWRPAPPPFGLQELATRTIGLVGYGAVGSLVAKRLQGFEVRILVYDPWVTADQLPSHVTKTALDVLLQSADIISMHARSTPETRHLLGAAELDLLSPQAVLINTARAELIDEEALIERLRDGRIAGAALDVFSVEPLPADHPLRSMERVSLSPHIAGVTVQARTNAPRLMAQRVAQHLSS